MYCVPYTINKWFHCVCSFVHYNIISAESTSFFVYTNITFCKYTIWMWMDKLKRLSYLQSQIEISDWSYHILHTIFCFFSFLKNISLYLYFPNCNCRVFTKYLLWYIAGKAGNQEDTLLLLMPASNQLCHTAIRLLWKHPSPSPATKHFTFLLLSDTEDFKRKILDLWLKLILFKEKRFIRN